jgi:hypothetical protein
MQAELDMDRQRRQEWNEAFASGAMVSKRKLKTGLKHGAKESEFGVTDRQYLEWITYVFDRDVRPHGSSWDADRAPAFDATPAETVGLIGKTMARSGTDLIGFSNLQVHSGLNYIFQPYSGLIQNFTRSDVSLELKIAAIGAMKRLYKDCFEARCDSCLGHLNEGRGLNVTAYMLWDDTPIGSWARDLPAANAAVMEVLEFALRSPNDACVESALHGLGHSRSNCPELVEPLIDHFLATTEDAGTPPLRGQQAASLRPVRKELRRYARQARFSHVL